MKKKILSLFLSAALLLGLCPAYAAAEDTASEEKITVEEQAQTVWTEEQPDELPPDLISDNNTDLPEEKSTDCEAPDIELSEEVLNSVIQDNDGQEIIAYVQLEGGMMLKGQESVFTVVNEGQSNYEYQYYLYYLPNGESGENYIGFRGTIDQNVELEEQHENILRYTPSLTGLYFLDTVITDTVTSREVVLQNWFFCSQLTGGDSTLGDRVENIIAACDAENLTTQREKALFVHDWITSHACYDTDYENYYPDGVLLRESGVCMSYALAYQIIMLRMGIPCIYVEGISNGNHAWNMIKLDEQWWHVDVTWDDPVVWDSQGESINESVSGTENDIYFCIEDELICSEHSWDRYSYPVCGGNSLLSKASPDRSVLLPEGFEVTDGNGNIYSQNTINGHKTVLVYGASWCGWTQNILEILNGLSSVLLKTETQVLACIDDADSETLDEFRTNWPNIIFTSEVPSTCIFYFADENYMISYPTSLAINEEGIVTSLITGGGMQNALQILANAQITDLSSLFEYKEVNGKIEILSYKGVANGETAYPSRINGKPVKRPGTADDVVGDNLVWRLEDGVLTISGSGYVYGDSKDTSGRDIYPWCELVEEIRTVKLENGVTGVGDYAFAGCLNLETLELPASLSSFSSTALEGCNKVNTICVDKENGCYKSVDGFLCTADGETLVACPGGKGGTVRVPEGIKTIGDFAFSGNSSVTTIILPEGIKNIGCSAFSGLCGTVQFTIPASLENIGNNAFADTECTIVYEGTQTAWNSISTGTEGNSTLGSAVFHYESKTEYIWSEDMLRCTATGLNNGGSVSAEAVVSIVRVKEPECESEGAIKYTAEFEAEWAYTVTSVVIIPALDHDWEETAYNWNSNHSTCTATRACKRDTTHVETTEATVTCKEISPAACNTDGEISYTACFTETWAVTQIFTETVPSLDHNLVFDHVDMSGIPYRYVFCCTNDNCDECSYQDVPVPKATAIRMDCGKEITVYLNDPSPLELMATLLPLNADQGIIWSGMKTDYFSYSQSGEALNITGFTGKTGVVTLTATAADGSKVKGTVKLTIARHADALDILDSRGTAVESAEIKGGASATFKTSLTAEGSITDKNVLWTIEGTGKDYVTVDNKGKVTVKPFAGTEKNVILTASVKAKADVCDRIELVLKPNLSGSVEILSDGKNINNAVLTYDLTESVPQLIAETVETAGDVVWKSSSIQVASVNANGCVSLNGAGTATITAICGKTKASFKLTVISKVQNISISGPDTLVSGRSVSFKAVISPAKVSDKTLIWSLDSKDAGYATISNGKLTAKPGLAHPVEVTVTVKSRDNGAEGTKTVTLNPVASSVKISGEPAGTVEMSNTLQLSATIEPFTAPQNINWKSSNAKFVIDSADNITALPGAKSGTVTFTAAAADGSGKKASVKIRFIHMMTADDLSLQETAVLASGKTMTIPYAVNTSVTNRKLVWTIDGTEYATLNNNKLTAKKNLNSPVSVAVTATAQDGSGISKSCTVTLYPAATDVSIMYEGTAVSGKSIAYGEGMKFELRNNPYSAAQVWTVKSSNAAILPVLNGNVLELTRDTSKALKAGSKVTVTVTAADGSGRSAKVTVTA